MTPPERAHPMTPHSLAHRPLRRRLLAGCALAAAMSLAGPAWAQGFAGTGTITSGTGTITTGPASTTINVTSGQTIIDWTPTDTATGGGAINFLPGGSSAEFYGNGQYIVLNRILPVDAGGAANPRATSFNGTVRSFINVPPSGPATRGGAIWFYNPYGLIAGSGSVFDVGSLVMTTNAITTTGGLLSPDGAIRFAGTAGSLATVEIQSGAQLGAQVAGNPGGAYLALVAPRIVQRGTVRADGSIAYVAAEQANITINNGLFDINVLVGAEGGTGIDHSGSTGGAAHVSGDTDANRIYMVAIAKNDALSMLVAGQVGYDAAAVASVEPNGAIRLSSGFNIFGGEVANNPVNANDANITINDSRFTSALTARASQDLLATPLGTIDPISPISPITGRIIFDQNATLTGDNSATALVSNGQEILAASGLTLRSGVAGNNGTATANVIGAPDSVLTAGLLDVAGPLRIEARGIATPTGNATGGSATLTVDGGTFTGGDVFVDATASGNAGTPAVGGPGTGGTALISVNGTGATFNANFVDVNATGRGDSLRITPVGTVVAATTGGAGTGGNASVQISGGARYTSLQGTSVTAQGLGSTGEVTGGAGQGGSAGITVTGAASQYSSANTNVDANGTGGGSLALSPLITIITDAGGAGSGGIASFVSNGISDAGTTFISANGQGGNAQLRGGDGNGGTASVNVTGGATDMDSLNASARGDGAQGDGTVTIIGQSGAANGGGIVVSASGGTLAIATDATLIASVASNASGGETESASQAGSITVQAGAGGTVSIGGTLDATASTRNSTIAGVITNSGANAAGGTITVVADNGTLSMGNIALAASAYSSNATGPTGSATGGTISVSATGGGAIETIGTGTDSLSAIGVGGTGNVGGQGSGGTITLLADDGSITLGNSTFANAGGTSGGSGTGNASALAGTGGTIAVTVTNAPSADSSIFIANFDARAEGRAGLAGEGGASAGNAISNSQGGDVTFTIAGGTLEIGTLRVSADAIGGASSGTTGNATGGTAQFVQTGGDAIIDQLEISADASGGASQNGGTGGTATGGIASVVLSGGTYNNAGGTFVNATGIGGAGNGGFNGAAIGVPFNLASGDGGNGVGGEASFTTSGTAVVTTGSVILAADGIGGTGGDYFAGSSGVPAAATGSGGSGQGGSAALAILGGTVTTDDIVVQANGSGGNGGALIVAASATGTGTGGNGGAAIGGNADLTLAVPAVLGGSLALTASAIGGDGGLNLAGGNGGNATGGTATFTADNFDAGTLGLTLDATAQGGNGANGLNGDGGNGGSGSGGTGRMIASGAAAAITTSGDNFAVTGTGGSGGDAFVDIGTAPAPGQGFDGGEGGAGVGGTIALLADQGTITLAGISGAPVTLSTTGIGGAGGDGADNSSSAGLVGGDAANGGGGRAGVISLDAAGGTIQSSGGTAVSLIAEGASGLAGVRGSGTGGDGRNAFDGTAEAGFVRLSASDAGGAAGRINLGDTTIAASGQSAGRVDILNSASGPGITLASLTATIEGGISQVGGPAAGDSGLYMRSANGRIAITGDATVTTEGSVGIDADGAGLVFIGGDATITAAEDVIINHSARSSTAPTMAVRGALAINAGHDILGGSGSIIDSGAGSAAGETLTLTSGTGTVDFDTMVTAGDATIDSGQSVTGSRLTIGGVAIVTAIQDIGIGTATIGSGSLNAFDEVALGTLQSTSGGVAISGDRLVSIDNADITDDLAIFASGQVQFSDLASTGTTEIQTFGAVSGGSINAGGDMIVTTEGAFALTGASGAAGRVEITGARVTYGSLESGGNTALLALNAGITGGAITSGGDISLSANGAVTVTDLVAGDALLVANGGRFTAGTITAGSAFVGAGGTVAFDTLATTGTATLQSDAAITGNSATSGGAMNLTATTGLAVDTIVSGSTTRLTTTSGALTTGSLTSAGAVTAAGDSVAITGNGPLRFAALTADVGGASVSTDGAMIVDTATVAGAANLTSTGGALTVTQMTAGSAALQAAGDVTTGTVTSAGALTLASGGTAAVTGTTSGQTISVTSRDVLIGDTGQLGIGGTTQTLSLTNNAGGAPTFIGGTTTSGPGYHLSAGEMAKLFANDIAISAPPAGSASGGPDMIIGAFTMRGGAAASGGNLGSNGNLTITSAGRIEVTGDVAMSDMGDGNALRIIGGTSIAVIAGEGSIALTGSGTTRGGTLGMSAETVYVASRDAIADVEDATSIDAIETRLAENDGFVSDTGALSAGGISVGVDGGLFIQNSGDGTDFAQRRGFTVGAGGFAIDTASASDRIVINGRFLNADGRFTTGLDAIGRLSVNGVVGGLTGFDPLSMMNGCVIVNPSSCRALSVDEPSFPPVQDVIDGPVEGGDGFSAFGQLVTMRDADAMAGEPLIDDPVTGTGNDDLWAGPEDEDEDE